MERSPLSTICTHATMAARKHPSHPIPILIPNDDTWLRAVKPTGSDDDTRITYILTVIPSDLAFRIVHEDDLWHVYQFVPQNVYANWEPIGIVHHEPRFAVTDAIRYATDTINERG